MFDLEFDLAHRPGALAELGEAMGRAGVAFEGGGVFAGDDRAVAHFLFEDGEAARAAAEAAGIAVVAMREPLIRQLKQGTPGQLGAIARALAEAGVNILTQYSDHHNRLILICDKPEVAAEATMAWEDGQLGDRERFSDWGVWSQAAPSDLVTGVIRSVGHSLLFAVDVEPPHDGVRRARCPNLYRDLEGLAFRFTAPYGITLSIVPTGTIRLSFQADACSAVSLQWLVRPSPLVRPALRVPLRSGTALRRSTSGAG